jgi:hypothetical protein
MKAAFKELSPRGLDLLSAGNTPILKSALETRSLARHFALQALEQKGA